MSAGPSVPEAARAARTMRWGERFRLAQTKYSAGASRPDVAAALMALADAEVAAAVAEERATTGRLLALLADLDERGRPGANDSPLDTAARRQIREDAKRFRAALASPGEPRRVLYGEWEPYLVQVEAFERAIRQGADAMILGSKLGGLLARFKEITGAASPGEGRG